MRRDTGDKELLGVDAAVARAIGLLDDVQQSLFDTAVARRDARTADVSTVEEAAEAAKNGFARIPWSALGTAGEAKLAESAVTVRCLQRADGSIPESEDEPDLVAFVARSY
jgi:prolyl-tRNA synthetase